MPVRFVTPSGGSVTLAASNSAITKTNLLPAVSGRVVLDTLNQTLTNKTLVNPTINTINSGPLAGFRNAIINGNFDFWQRGTSSTTSYAYVADRWRTVTNGSTFTTSRQVFTPGQTDVPNEPTYFCRTQVTSVAGAANFAIQDQHIEDVRTFAGQQVTVSFWIKADAARPFAFDLNQGFGTGGSPSTQVQNIGLTKVILSTSWQKISMTTFVPSISGKTFGTDNNSNIRLRFWFDAGSDYNALSGGLGQQSGTFDIAQVQLELGPVATSFERRPPQTEFALCQRYYQNSSATNSGSIYGTVVFHANYWASAFFPVPMRGLPTFSIVPAAGSAVGITANQFGYYANYNATTGAYYIASAEY